jgi:DNA/RNA-binding domain of Phe-tRNA-synthetase-like protein
MKELYINVAAEVFELFPGYVRGLVIAQDVKNGSSPDELVRLLREAEESVRGRLNLEKLAEDNHIQPWREAYRKFGAKPSEFRSSIEAMVRRALRNDPLPSINALVDIGNLLSLRHLLPVGSHAVDVLDEDMDLRLATGEEDFVAFGSDQHENPLKGEVIFAEGNTVLTRRWTWRQANRTLTLPETRAVEFNVDGMPPAKVADVEKVCQETIELVERFCGGRMIYGMLSRETPKMRISA